MFVVGVHLRPVRLVAAPVVEGAGIVEPFQQRPAVEVDERPVDTCLRQSVQDALRQIVGGHHRALEYRPPVHRPGDQVVAAVRPWLQGGARDETDPDGFALPVGDIPCAADCLVGLGPDRHGKHLGFVRIELARRQVFRERPAQGHFDVGILAAVGQRFPGIGGHPEGQVPLQRPGDGPLGRLGVGRSGPDVDAVNAAVGHHHRLGADDAVAFGGDAGQGLAGLDGLGDRGPDGREVGTAAQERGDRDEVFELSSLRHYGGLAP